MKTIGFQKRAEVDSDPSLISTFNFIENLWGTIRDRNLKTHFLNETNKILHFTRNKQEIQKIRVLSTIIHKSTDKKLNYGLQ